MKNAWLKRREEKLAKEIIENEPNMDICEGTSMWMDEIGNHYKIIHNETGKFYYKNGKFHREDGPAIEFTDETEEWHENGIRLKDLKMWTDDIAYVIAYSESDAITKFVEDYGCSRDEAGDDCCEWLEMPMTQRFIRTNDNNTKEEKTIEEWIKEYGRCFFASSEW